MQFIPTLTINNSIYSLLCSGHLRLQVGQWIQLDWLNHPSRFVGRLPGSGVMWAVNSDGTKVSLSRFKELAATYRKRVERA